MKKQILALSMCILTMTASTNAQDLKPIEYGIKSNINYGKIDGSIGSIDLNESKAGFGIGGYMKKKLSNNLSFISELNLNVRNSGGDQNFDATQLGFDSGTIKFKTDYSQSNIEIPILLQYETKKGFNLYGGSYLGFNLSNKGSLDVSGENLVDFGVPVSAQPETFDIKGDQRLDYGLVVGTGYQFNKFRFDVRYVFGLADYFNSIAIDQVGVSPDESVDSKNRYAEFSIAYQF